MKKSEIREALRDTLPVMTGYLVLGSGFGIIMTSGGYGFLYPLAMSVFIYAGSMQYAAIGLFAAGASPLTVALTTLAVNARHIFYGISMIDKYRNTGLKKPYLIFSLTDETYSLVCQSEKSGKYYFLVSVFDHFYWIAGTAIGALLGDFLHFNTEGIDFALTALFITIFVDQWMNSKKHFPAVTGVLASVICLLIFDNESFLIPSMCLILVTLLIYMTKGERADG